MKSKSELLIHIILVVFSLAGILRYKSISSFTQSHSLEILQEAKSDNQPDPKSEYLRCMADRLQEKLTKIKTLESKDDRIRGYLSLADEAYRTSSAAASAIIMLIVAEADGDILKNAKDGLLVLCNVDLNETSKDFPRLGALCYQEALNQLIERSVYSTSRPDIRRNTLDTFCLENPVAAAQFINANPETFRDLESLGSLAKDQRRFGEFVNELMQSLAFPREFLNSQLLMNPFSLPVESRLKVAEGMAKETEVDDIRSSIRLFYSEADETTRELMDRKASPQVAELLEEEKKLLQGLTSENFEDAFITLLRVREQPLTDRQTAILLNAAYKTGELNTARVRDVLFKVNNPQEFVNSIPEPESNGALFKQIYENWATADAVGFSAELSAKSVPNQDLGIEALVRSQADDPVSQLIWAQKITDAADRHRVLVPILEKNIIKFPELVRSIAAAEGYSLKK